MNLLKLLTKKALPLALAFTLLFTSNMQALAQALPSRFARTYDPKNLTAVQDNTRVVIPISINDLQKKSADSESKLISAYSKQVETEQKTSDALKAQYKYSEYDKTGYLKAGQWAAKRKDGSTKNTGFFGEIVLQGGKYRGKVITEASVIINQDGKDIEVPLLNPMTNSRDLETLRYGNINQRLIQQARLWLTQCQRQKRSTFALESEVRPHGQWAYADFQNILQVSMAEMQRRANITARINNGEKNPYFFGEQYNEWNKVEQQVKQARELEQQKQAIMKGNNLLTEKDADKIAKIAKEEYTKNEQKINRAFTDKARNILAAAQQKARNLGLDQITGGNLSIQEAVALGLVSPKELERAHQTAVDETIANATQTKVEKYLQNESNHNTANNGILGSMGIRFNYFWTHVQNNSILGKASLWLGAGVKGLATWSNPQKIYQQDFQSNQNFLNYYNMGTKWSFVDEIALTAGTFATDAAIFQGLGKAAAATLPQVTATSSLATQIVVPSVRTGSVLAAYDGINSFGNKLGYKDLGAFTDTDWKAISYDAGRGFATGAVVAQYGRLLSGINAAPSLMPQPMSVVLKNGARNMALGMSEGAVFSISGTTYDQLNGMWLPAIGSPDYIGGNVNAFAQMTPTILFKDMIKFYFAIKLPGKAMFDNTPSFKTPKVVNEVASNRAALQQKARQISENKAKQWAEADLKAARRASIHKADIKVSNKPVAYDKNTDWLLTAKDGTQQVFRPGANFKTGTIQPLLPTETVVTQNTKNFTATIGEGAASGGSGVSNASAAANTVVQARPASPKPVSLTLPAQPATTSNTVVNGIKNRLGSLAYRAKVLTMALAVPVGTTAAMSVPMTQTAPSAIYQQATAQNTLSGAASTNAAAASQYATTSSLYAKASAQNNTARPINSTPKNGIKLPFFAAVRDGWDLGGGGGSGSGSFKNLKGDLTPYSRHQLALYELGVSSEPEWLNQYRREVKAPIAQQPKQDIRQQENKTSAFTQQTKATQQAVAASVAALPQNWQLLDASQTLNNKQQLVAEVRVAPNYDNPINVLDANEVDPVASASLFGGMLFAKIKNISLSDNIAVTLANKNKANKFAKEVFTKKAPLPSQLKAILASNADDSYKAQAIQILYHSGFLNQTVKTLPESSKNLLTTKEGLFNLYNARLFDSALEQVQDVIVPIQNRISKAERAELEKLKEVSNNLNDEITAAIADWGTGVTLFETPATNKKLIASSVRNSKYIEDNASKGNVSQNYTYYENNIPVYYRDKDGDISNKPRILLSYSQISSFSTFLSKLGLATKKGFKIPNGLVLALDEEGKFKLVMPLGNLNLVENNPVAKKVTLEGKETNKMMVDAEFTSSDLIEIAALLEKDDDIAFEIDLNRPDSFKIFLAFHALFIGNDAGNTLTGQVKDYAEKAGGNAAVNAMGGVGYVTPFLGGIAMKAINKFGHVKSILAVYSAVLLALGYSFFHVGINGFYDFPKEPFAMDWINLAIPTSVMVLGGSVLNTAVSTLLNVYKDPVARTTAHLQYANNKNYSRLGVAAITGIALVSNLGLNWSVVVPAAVLLLVAAGALLFNTRIYDQYKAEKAKKKAYKDHSVEEKGPSLTEEQATDKAELDAFVKKAKSGFANIYKKEIKQRHEMKDISRRVSKLYASYAASLMILTQVLKMAADEVVGTNIGQHMALALAAAITVPILLTLGYKKLAGKETNIPTNLKKYLFPEIFFAATLATMFFASDGKGLGMAFTTLCLLTTTMMRVFSTELIKSKKATDDQLSGLSIPLIAAMTTVLVFAPATGPWAIGSLVAALLLYAGTAVPGQLDSARMQNFITAVYKEKKEHLKNQNLDSKEYKKHFEALKAEEKYMASKGAAKYSYLNGAGVIGILVAVGAAFVLQDLSNAADAAQMVADPTWQEVLLQKIAAITGHPFEDSSFSFSRLILAYSALVALWMTKQNWHLTKAGMGLFKKQQITQELIDQGKITAKDFDINSKNAAIKLSVFDKEIKDINGIVFSNGKSSETKMTEILNKLFIINNRLVAISEILGDAALKKSFEQLKFVTSNLAGMVQNNDLSKSYKAQYNTLVQSLAADTPKYLEEGLYNEPKSLSNYEKGLIYMRELKHLADDIANHDVKADTYEKFSKYYTKAVQDLTQYAQDNPFDSERVNNQIRTLRRLGAKMSRVEHNKNTVVPQEDIEMLQETIKLFR